MQSDKHLNNVQTLQNGGTEVQYNHNHNHNHSHSHNHTNAVPSASLGASCGAPSPSKPKQKPTWRCEVKKPERTDPERHTERHTTQLYPVVSRTTEKKLFSFASTIDRFFLSPRVMCVWDIVLLCEASDLGSSDTVFFTHSNHYRDNDVDYALSPGKIQCFQFSLAGSRQDITHV